MSDTNRTDTFNNTVGKDLAVLFAAASTILVSMQAGGGIGYLIADNYITHDLLKLGTIIGSTALGTVGGIKLAKLAFN